ncbi:glutathione Stransferase [Puccinia graminis f. sp. tritici]|uniref:Glutathione Stransferase n=2 Tax=Puccinia graminis f. sp. tritici TaxID=56615 RepID=E3KG35_PUCGT|nr:uncharacterized protein PGTG_09102 [Puccinia graminis f. sp. tritici CRL 75-36-700-3]EFP83149.2 hypothetical protein PGTG_09102 [Puccinia graminis f. sp. tritici CRL 75-36-700-3]KAA1089156.1 glutathione Stransferase [Puccinia graminis f. sp. tritici]
MAFHYADIPFIDERLSSEEFAKIKETLPFGQVPILTVDEKLVIPHETAILKYVGRLAGLYPDDLQEVVKVDAAMCIVDDLSAAVVACWAPEHPGKEMVTKIWIEERIPKLFGYIDRYLANAGTTFSAGNSLTVADLRLYWAITYFKSGRLQKLPIDLIDNYPSIIQLYQAIQSHERLASFIKAESQLVDTH